MQISHCSLCLTQVKLWALTFSITSLVQGWRGFWIQWSSSVKELNQGFGNGGYGAPNDMYKAVRFWVSLPSQWPLTADSPLPCSSSSSPTYMHVFYRGVVNMQTVVLTCRLCLYTWSLSRLPWWLQLSEVTGDKTSDFFLVFGGMSVLTPITFLATKGCESTRFPVHVTNEQHDLPWGLLSLKALWRSVSPRSSAAIELETQHLLVRVLITFF